MKTRAWPLLLVIAGCSVIPERRTDVADGMACEASSECVSKECGGGYCEGRSCKLEDPSSCDPGWRCTHFERSFLSAGRIECVPLCGVCPANTHCPLAGEDGVTACANGAPRKVTITGPSTVKVNGEVTFSVAVDPPFPEVVRVEWLVGDKPGTGQGFGPETTTTTATLGVNVETDLFVSAIVHGKVGMNELESAGGAVPLHIECLAEGDVCDADGEGYEAPQYCCAAGLYCPGQTNSKEPKYCARQN